MRSTEQPGQSVRGVVLAGGDSTRFEAGDKALATVGSRPLLTRILDVVAQTTHREPVIAVRTVEQQARYATVVDQPVEFVFDAADREGPLAGLSSAAAALDSRWLFCCGCDMPLLAPSAVTWMIHQLPDEQPNSHPQVDAVAIKQSPGVLDPLHALYRRASIVDLHQTLPRTAGPRRLLSELNTVLTISTADSPAEIPLETSTTNINTVDELEQLHTK